MKTLIKVIAIALLSIGSINAKPGGGFSSSSSSSRSSSSSSSSSSSRPSSSWSSSSKPSTPTTKPSVAAPAPKATSSWSSSSKPSSSASATSSSASTNKGSWLTKPQTSTRPNSSVERQRYESAVKSGKSFTSREAAVADFKTKEATKYSSRYTTEPAQRPSFIPKTYNNQTIVYNQAGGGYGYYSGGGPGLGTFMLYDLASDAIMMDTMMRRSNNYYVGTPPPATVVYTSNSIGFFGWVLIFTACIIFLGFVGFLFKNA